MKKNVFFIIYQKLLWLLGFKTGEYITFMLKRQEQRLGVFWWLTIGATLGYLTILIHTWVKSPVWFSILVYPVNELALVLVWHVVKTPGVPEK